jgi:glutamyl-tRNA reductase
VVHVRMSYVALKTRCQTSCLRAISECRFMLQVEEWMSQASGVPLEELRQYMFLYHDGEATEHIMRVSGGLDSLVMGEGQILAQVAT